MPQVLTLLISKTVTENDPEQVLTTSLSHNSPGKGKSKAFPLQTLTGPEGSRRLRLPDFKTIGTRS
jgi:hypothetical protein